jgi:hypothetical protein
MSSEKDERLRKALQTLHRKPFHTIVATVTAVDRQELSCDVEPLDGGAAMFDVRLRAALDNERGGLVLLPAVGSTVLVSAINDNWNFPYVAMVSEVDLVSVKTQQESLKTLLNDILTAIQQLTVPTPAGPSGVPINLASFQQYNARLDNLFLD